MYVFYIYVWGPHGGWAMLSGLVHTCMYVFKLYWFCTVLYIHVPSVNKDFIIIILMKDGTSLLVVFDCVCIQQFKKENV